ncbi:syntabulin isoform X2 [Xenopus laevis]|uniref:Syntabulin isoform X2 n=1 Tax=Xenopus laevis TaxID=8355 RepID=A0A8J0VKM0_XENLA|nr:syntabulin isoform X2 [Xenopus laevis]
MGPLQESKKMQERELARSRIPRLVLRPYLPKQKKSPSSESPFSEEESKDFHSRRSARTISSNSFCSDDTGCPSSQSVSPVKTPSDAGLSPMEFCTGGEEHFSCKRVSVSTFIDTNTPPARYKKGMKISLLKTGSEADFSSSSSTGSISAPEVHMTAMSGGKKASFSRNRISHGKGNISSTSKPGSSPPGARDKDLFSVLCRNPVSPVNVHDPYGVSSASSSNSSSYKGSDTSPTPRRTSRYASCGDNHGIKPPSPEQYLTPLQQKEVSIRHLKAKLKESQGTLEDREAEIVDLKIQLGRMREDWIEEECHRVEAQLALKEARKEIKQLKQFIETMKNSLAEKDKGIQKYFIDINIQNKKLETLLRSMELAQDGGLGDEAGMDYICNSPGASLTESAIYDKMSDGLLLEDQATEEMADCDLLLNDDLANRDDLFDEIMMETSSELGSLTTFGMFNEKTNFKRVQWMEQAIQTDVVPYSLDFENTILKIFKANNDGRSPFLRGLNFKCSAGPTTLIDLTPDDPNSAILLSPDSLDKETVLGRRRSCAMKELDFEGVPSSEGFGRETAQACVAESHWSNHFFTDLLAVAVPIIPTVLWALNTQRGNPDPVYNIGTMMRGCCLLALHSLRKSSGTTPI